MIRDVRGLAVLILATGLATGHVVGIVGFVYWGRPLGEAGAQVLVSLGGAMIGAIAGFLGARSLSENGK